LLRPVGWSANRFAREIADGVKRTSGIVEQLALEGLRQQIAEMAPRVRQVMKQARARVFGGNAHVEGKLLSLFEPSTEIIRKGKTAKPNEFGKMVKRHRNGPRGRPDLVHGLDDDSVMAFTDDGVDSLVELIKIHREMPPRPAR
jgi:hypothetical protein